MDLFRTLTALVIMSICFGLNSNWTAAKRKKSKSKFKYKGIATSSNYLNFILPLDNIIMFNPIFYSVITPPPKCQTPEATSAFSVTGFLTFSVVAATSLANIIANINNNNNNNNDNNNNDNQNDNNQMSNNTMSGGKRRKRTVRDTNKTIPQDCQDPHQRRSLYCNLNTLLGVLPALFKFCPQRYICESAKESKIQQSELAKRISLFSTTFSAFVLSDFTPNLTPYQAFDIIQMVKMHTNCGKVQQACN